MTHSLRGPRVGLLALGLAIMASAVAGPAASTLGALMTEEHGDAGWFAAAIPRDFPIPASSHDLHGSNAVPMLSISGTPKVTDTFYRDALPQQGWAVEKHQRFPGVTAFVACRASQCVSILSQSAVHDSEHPDLIELKFFPRDDS